MWLLANAVHQCQGSAYCICKVPITMVSRFLGSFPVSSADLLGPWASHLSSMYLSFPSCVTKDNMDEGCFSVDPAEG